MDAIERLAKVADEALARGDMGTFEAYRDAAVTLADRLEDHIYHKGMDDIERLEEKQPLSEGTFNAMFDSTMVSKMAWRDYSRALSEWKRRGAGSRCAGSRCAGDHARRGDGGIARNAGADRRRRGEAGRAARRETRAGRNTAANRCAGREKRARAREIGVGRETRDRRQRRRTRHDPGFGRAAGRQHHQDHDPLQGDRGGAAGCAARTPSSRPRWPS